MRRAYSPVEGVTSDRTPKGASQCEHPQGSTQHVPPQGYGYCTDPCADEALSTSAERHHGLTAGGGVGISDPLADDVADHDAIGRQLVEAVRDALVTLARVLPENTNAEPTKGA